MERSSNASDSLSASMFSSSQWSVSGGNRVSLSGNFAADGGEAQFAVQLNELTLADVMTTAWAAEVEHELADRGGGWTPTEASNDCRRLGVMGHRLRAEAVLVVLPTLLVVLRSQN